MRMLEGYTFKDSLYKSDNSEVFRGIREVDGLQVVIKTTRDDFNSNREANRLKHEFTIGKILSGPNSIKYLDLIIQNDSYYLISEHLEGTVIRDLIGKEGMELNLFFELARKTIEVLDEIHSQNVIHKDINPTNIVYLPTSGHVKIIDFDISTSLKRENQEGSAVNLLEGTLAYISPEQTGRMNRTIDYRSDYYSLGITFYEMLTGVTPFKSKDKLELIHAHIAIEPRSVSEISPKIPEMVSQVVMKLISKTAEQRYKSTFGLLQDLKKCEDEYLATGRIKPFELGQQDISSRFNIPEKLYGREQDVKILLETFDRVCEGRREILMVRGYSGVGKSALVQEIQKPVIARKGYFISGKFDQYHRNLPYSALIGGYKQLIQQFLTEGKESLDIWKEKFLNAFGPNGQLIVDVIPEIELIIGKQSPPPFIRGEAERNRFTLVFRNFIKTLTSAEHPLVVFLDDMQWADSATINLIQNLLHVTVHEETKHLFLIGAYRDNEVNDAHPLKLMFDQVKEYGVEINNITLSPLGYENLQQLVADTLESPIVTIDPLAEIIFEKTAGNPFFINQFFRSLYDESLLTFDTKKAIWAWDVEKIKEKSFTDNVIDLMSAKIKKLDSAAQNVLKIASTIGLSFKINMISELLGKTEEDIKNDLAIAATEGLVIPNAYSEEVISKYKFLHDRVQQAAYSLLEPQELLQTRYKIGSLLLDSVPEKQDELLFDIVNHLNFSKSLISDPKEKIALAILNRNAGFKAKSSNAYEAALEYLNTGISLLPEDAWIHHYSLAHGLYSASVEAAFLNKDFAQMEEKLAAVEKFSKELIDKIPSLEIKIQALAAESKLIEAIEEATSVLALLGVMLPKNPGKMDIMKGLIGAKWVLGRKKPHQLLDLPEMNDPLKLAAMRILISTTSSAFLAMPNMFPLIVFSLVKLSLHYGNSKYSTYGYATYGLVSCGALGDMKGGNEFGRLALELMEKYDARELMAKVYFVFYAFIFQWKNPLKETKQFFLEGYKSGLETGDFEYGGWNAYHYCSYSFFAGEPLEITSQNFASMKEQGEKLGINQVTLLMDVFIPVLGTLTGDIFQEKNLVSENFTDDLMPLFKDLKYTTAIYERNLSLGMCNYYFRRYDVARKYFDEAEPLIESVVGMEYTPQFYFFAALTLIRTADQDSKTFSKKFKLYSGKLKKWAEDSPFNYLHKYELVMAEYYRHKGDKSKAEDFYCLAIDNSHLQKYLNDEAIANECAAEFYLAQNKKDIALTYIIKARYTYLKWGAKAKVNQIDTKYQQLLNLAIKSTADFRNRFSDSTKSTTFADKTTDAVGVDMLTVIKASQTISGEIVLENLLRKLMVLLNQNAGAEKGFLLLENNGSLFIEAESSKNSEEVQTLHSQPLESCGKLAESIVKYVALTKETVILDDASESTLFVNDEFIQTRKPKSILCAPFLNHGKLQGIIYLSNDLTAGAFTEKRLAMLKLLTGQIAISIENALFYDQLEQRVSERTTELQEEKKKSDDLLLNILPQDIANELKQTGHSKARSYEQVSVMFTDFKEFTRHSEKLKPEELVAEIDFCFRKFDEIITKHKLEKIKTIGDAYLCVEGIPKSTDSSVDNVILAALDILDFMLELKESRSKENKNFFELRIGIHTGPLVAGIVGMKKFAFDIWGDTVNTAARMEQSGQPGKINISQSTYDLIKGKFNCEYRGEIDAKNKGKLKMYFVNSIKEAVVS
jgi:predicted ATPase/class 3 adenylate cyclase/tRNA A-37 threonylcarbamoyl transferase component Bud32